ncbi:hypothetical protein JCM3766R1_006912 [Sporobolomyces carnicolor]
MTFPPRVGTAYPSTLAFKIDTFEGALRESLRFVVDSGGRGAKTTLCCRTKGTSREDPCSFRVTAKDADGVVTVIAVDDRHSCDGEARRRTQEETKKVMSDKIARLKAELDDANLATMQSQVAEDDSEQVNTREEDDSDDETSAEEDETSPAESEQKSYDLLVCDDPDASPPQVTSMALYPSARDLR